MVNNNQWTRVALGFSTVLLLVLLSSAIVLIGNLVQDANIVYIGVFLSFVIFSVRYLWNLRQDIIIFLFNLSIFIFLLGRYLVRMLDGTPMDVGPPYVTTALNLVFISLLTVNFVYLLGSTKNKIFAALNLTAGKKEKGHFKRIDLFANVGFVISGVCTILTSFALYGYAAQHGYSSLYANPVLPLPTFITTTADTLPFFVALCLARLPNKKVSYRIFLSYIVLLLPLLMAGKRMTVMIGILVWATYIILRHYKIPNGEQWIARGEKIAVAIIVPIIIILIPLIGGIRGGDEGSISRSGLNGTLDSQGITLDIVSHGLRLQSETPQSIYGFYTFAPVLDYVSTNFISRAVLGTQEIPKQTRESAELGKSYADTISYMVLRRDLYFSGQGLGSSYIIETYIDFGVVGLIIYSALIALLILWMTSNFGKSYLKTFLIIMLMIQIYSLPRDTSTEFIVAIFQIQTIAVILFVVVYDAFIRGYRRTIDEKRN